MLFRECVYFAGAHITPEWRKQYIQYEEMKAMLCNAIHEAPSSEVVEPEVLDRYYAKFDETFYFDSSDDISPCVFKTQHDYIKAASLYTVLHRVKKIYG